MVSQFALPRSIREQSKRRDVQDVGVVTEFAEKAPKLALALAKRLFGEGEDIRNVYSKTGWFQGPNKEWLYNYADQGMKLREDNKLLMRPGETPYVNRKGEKAEMYEQPGIPMKESGAGYTTPKEAYVYRPGQEPRLEPQQPVERARFGDPSAVRKVNPGDPLPPWLTDRPPGELPQSLQTEPLAGQLNLGLEDMFQYGLTRPNRTRDPTFNELFSHPNQEQLAPELGGIPVDAKFSFPSGSTPDAGGQFNMQDKWDVQPYPPWQPGQVEGSSASFHGGLGGVSDLWSMPSVALHEVVGHGGQQLGKLPRGGSPGTQGNLQFGQQMMAEAAQALRDMHQYEGDELLRLMNSGLSRQGAEAMFRQMNPEYWSTFSKYDKIANQRPPEPWPYQLNNPSQLGYLATQGEAQALNFQKRAAELSNRIPMTGETRMGPDFAKPLEGDVYPLSTYPIPPDMLHGEVTKGFATNAAGQRTGVDVENLPQPQPGSFSWLMKKPPMDQDTLARMLLNQAGMGP